MNSEYSDIHEGSWLASASGNMVWNQSKVSPFKKESANMIQDCLERKALGLSAKFRSSCIKKVRSFFGSDPPKVSGSRTLVRVESLFDRALARSMRASVRFRTLG